MKNIGKRTLSLLTAAVMLLSLVAFPGWTAQAAEEDPHLLFDYNYSSMNGDTVVEDADAYQGMAKQYTTNLSAASIPLYRYESSNPEFQYQYIKLGAIAKADLKVDQGYQTYSFVTTLPETGMLANGNFVYFTDSWAIQNAAMAKDLRTLAGRTVTVNLSMKITGTDLSAATVYVDRMSITDACDEYRVGDYCSKCGADLSQNVDADAHTLYDYNYSKFNGDVSVEDADAYQGMAKQYTMNLSAASIPLYRYDPDCTIDGVKTTDVKLGAIAKEDLKLNEGYQTYSFITTLPAEGMSDNTAQRVYFTGNWTLQNNQMAKDLKALAGQTVTILMSMKIVATDITSATVYVDRMQIVDFCKDNLSENGTYCAACGKTFAPLPEELQNVDAQHITTYDVSDFGVEGGGSYTVDNDSPMGQVFTTSGVSVANGFNLYRYASFAEEGNNYIKLASVAAADVKMNDGYHFYKSTVTIPENIYNPGNYVYVDLNNAWKCMNYTMSTDLGAMAGKTVDVYVSMKVVGTDASNVQVYIDQMVLVDCCCNYQFGKVCSVCGKDLSDTVDATKHVLFNYDYSSFSGGGNATTVEDADSYNGYAKQYSTFNFSTTASIPLYRYGTSESPTNLKLGAVATSELVFDDQYHTYSMTTTLPEDSLKTDGNFVYFTDGWTIQNYPMANNLKTLAGKTVTISISMKVTGELAATTVYIERIQILDQCEDHISDNGTYCTVCHKSLLDYSLPEELQLLDTDHISRYDTSDIALKTGESIVEDAESPVGKAWAYAMNVTNGLELRWYAAGVADRSLLKIPYANIVQDDGYHFYKTSLTVWEDLPASGSYTYIDWRCTSANLCNDLIAYKGKTVDLYMSLKVTDVYTDASGKLIGNVYIDQFIIVDPCDNHWDEGVVTKAPTTETEGIKTYTCTVCGETKTEVIEKLPAPAASWNLELDGNIGMNFILNVTAEQAAAATVEYTVGGVSTTKNVSELVNEAGEAILTVELAAAQMIENVTVTVNADGTQMTKTYSVREYAEYILNGEYSDETKNLVKAMLTYGAASQTYFDYQADTLVNAGWEIEAAAVPTEGGSMDVAGQVSGVIFHGASLIHQNKIGVRFYFTADSLDGISFGDFEAVEKNGMYCVEFANICPQDLDEDLTVSVTDGTDIQTITYAPMDYIIRMYAKGGDSAALVQALYGYYLAAEAYIAA